MHPQATTSQPSTHISWLEEPSEKGTQAAPAPQLHPHRIFSS